MNQTGRPGPFEHDEFPFDRRLVVIDVMIGRRSSLLATTRPSATAPAFLDKGMHESNCVAHGDSGKRVALTALGDRVGVALAPGTSLHRRVAVLALSANCQNSESD
jgi:hypothetical protein